MERQNQRDETYTLGLWTVKPGKENEFVDQWTVFAKWTSKNFSEAKKAYLLQDEKNSLRFISFGPWTNENAIEKWRDSTEFKNFVGTVKELCNDFQPNTLKPVSSSK